MKVSQSPGLKAPEELLVSLPVIFLVAVGSLGAGFEDLRAPLPLPLPEGMRAF